MRRVLVLATAALVSVGGIGSAQQTDTSEPAGTETAPAEQTAVSAPELLVEGLAELQGSTIGPDGALLVTAPLSGEIWSVDLATGATTLFAAGLPARNPEPFHVGSGVVDVAFLDGTAYALITSVGVELGSEDFVKGIYRIDGPESFTVIADLGAWATANKPAADIFIDSGFQFAIQAFGDGFLVTDGHHNKVLSVSLEGDVTELMAWGNVVPTGLAVSGDTIYVSQAGPLGHAPEDGKVLVFDAGSSEATEVAAGAPPCWWMWSSARTAPS